MQTTSRSNSGRPEPEPGRHFVLRRRVIYDPSAPVTLREIIRALVTGEVGPPIIVGGRISFTLLVVLAELAGAQPGDVISWVPGSDIFMTLYSSVRANPPVFLVD